MYDPRYNRDQFERAKRLSRKTSDREIGEMLERAARDYAEIAEDLEVGAIDIRHREMMPQTQHDEDQV